MIIYMQHEEHGNHIVYEEAEAKACEKLGWKRVPFPKVKENPVIEPEDEADELEELRVEAESKGIIVDGRWKAKRIREEIAKAE